MSIFSRFAPASSLFFALSLFLIPGEENIQAEEETPAAAATTPASQENSQEQSENQDDEEKWVSLFDGKSLGSWGDAEDAGSIKPEIKDGALVLGMGAMSSGVRYKEDVTDGSFPTTNYEIEYVAKRQLGNDFFAAMTFPVGDSCCTLINGGWGGGLLGLSSIDGMDASENNFSSYFPFKNKIWYTFRIRVADAMITVWVDDEKIIDLVREGHQFSTRIEMKRYCPFGIATWISEGWIRSIRCRLLTDQEISDIAQEADRQKGTKRTLKLK